MLAGCERERILEGERFDTRAVVEGPRSDAPENRSAPLSLPPAEDVADWPQRLGRPGDRVTHAALAAAPTHRWSAEIGAGEDRRHRITADPVAAGGRIFTLDSRATVTATSASGETLWQRDLTPSYAGRDDASGGGLAHGEGRLFVASAFGRLVALDPATGDQLWAQRFDAPLTAPPLVAGGRVFVVDSGGTAWSIDTRNGRVDWQLSATEGTDRLVGGASPALAGRLVVLPFPSGEVRAVLRDSGRRIWAAHVRGRRLGRGYSHTTDITADPLMAGGRVHIANQGGELLALDPDGGETIWTADEGAPGPVWEAAGALFFVTDENRLVRLDAATGARVWSVELPNFTDDDFDDRAEIFVHHGPVLAGGRLILISSDGRIRSFDPESGAMLSERNLPAAAATRPIIVDGTLYFVSTDGRLHAFR
ncbi:quinoprotein [Rhodobacteraceae bacterium WD3A24]|nr:quinoprotein [Rhodobacteraceae bacterium WD3A24]